jgi:3-oxoacyl-[acyl-carrier protein] reductase
MSKLTGKVAVVTGASKGIGAAIAKSLAAEGASVVVNYASSKAGADRVVAAITAAGGKAVAVPGDVSKAAEAQGIIEAAIKNYGRLDILVNNSGVYEYTPLEAITRGALLPALQHQCAGPPPCYASRCEVPRRGGLHH